MHLTTDPEDLARIAAESDARVLAARRQKAADALRSIGLHADAHVVTKCSAADLRYIHGGVTRHRAACTHGSPEHVAATVARDALGALWAVL